MAHHKRRKPKNARAGCLFCKPHKANGAKCRHRLQERRGRIGFREQLRALRAVRSDGPLPSYAP